MATSEQERQLDASSEQLISMRSGPRTYTDEQAAFIAKTVSQRQARQQLLTVPQVAQILEVPPHVVQRLIHMGRLQADTSYHSAVITLADLNRYVEERRIAVDEAAAYFMEAQRNYDPVKAHQRFEEETGQTPGQYLADWKAGKIEDTAENMRCMIQAMSLDASPPPLPIDPPEGPDAP